MAQISMRPRLSERLRALPSVRDARILVEGAAAIIATWLLLGWTFGDVITQADGTWLVVPYTDSLLHANGDWTQHLYRFGVLGGSEMHAFGGTLPLVQVAAWLDLSTTTTVNLVTWFVQLSYGFFGVRLAESMASAWRGEPVGFDAARRVLAFWLIAFAPLLGNRLAVGHENLLLGFLPLFATVSLLWQARAAATSVAAMLFATFVISNGISGLGAQSLFYSVVFGIPLLVVTMWRWRRGIRPVLEIAITAVAALLLMLPRLVPMVAHAFGPDATRGVGSSVTTSYGAAPASDWLTSIVWSIGDRAAATVHEHNYPLGPLALVLVVLWPRRTSRALLWTLLGILVIVIVHASEVSPLGALLGELPIVNSFRGPSRAAMAALLFVPALSVAAWRTHVDSPPSSRAGWLTVALGAVAILLLRDRQPWLREIVAWLAAMTACYAALDRRMATKLRAHVLLASLACLAALGVLAFAERLPHVPRDPVERGPRLLRTALASELTSALDRVAIPDAPAPYEMSLAFAARLPSLDGVWYAPPRYLDLLSTLSGRRLPPTAAVFRTAQTRYFPVLQQLYNVRVAVRGLHGPTPTLEELPPTPGAAWFPQELVTINTDAELLRDLASTGLRSIGTRAWVHARERHRTAPETCSGARVDRVATDALGQNATFDVTVPAPCVLVVATNFVTTLAGRGVIDGSERDLDVFPIDIALTGIVVPANTTQVRLGPRLAIPWWAALAPWISLLALGALCVSAAKRFRMGILAAALVVVATGCRSRQDTPPPEHADVDRPVVMPADGATHDAASPDLNVLLVMIDTVRADRLGVAGYRRDGRSLTPHLDALAVTATRFTRAYAHAANTPRSYPSLAASRLPSQITFHKSFHNFPAVLDDNVLLFEVLAAAGLWTTSFTSHFYFEPRRNVTQGFAEYDNSGALDLAGGNRDYAAPRIVPKAIARLESLARERTPFAMFVHLFEPHSTYIDHPEYPVTARGEAGLVERYDYEIAVVDRWVGTLLAALDTNDLRERTVVVVLSDHGEAFGIHSAAGQRAFFHGQTLYDEVLRVPLLIRIPGVAPSVRDEVVGLIDVAPTIVDALGITSPPSFTGRSLLPLMRGESLPPRDVRAELPPTPDYDETIEALVTSDGREKIIVTAKERRLEIYDLQVDPDERTNLAGRDKMRDERLRKALEASRRQAQSESR